MNTTGQLHRRPADWIQDSQLAPYLDAFIHYLSKRRYAPHTISTNLSCIAHFARWMSQCQLDVYQLNEEVVRRFLDDHLPQCDCARPVHRTRNNLRAALRHLLVVLRTHSVIVEPVTRTTPIDEELRRFDDYMDHVRGLSLKTRSTHLRTAHRLLLEQFGDRPIDFSTISPDDVRQFVTGQSELYSTADSAKSLVAALRGYFRYRSALGDQVNSLIAVLSYPANWQMASLPKALSRDEVERLVDSLGSKGSSTRRADAMVRCALDLGLRCGEIARLTLDDIDWCAGTVTLRKTKSRREDVLPLPVTTGKAIADYLQLERSQTSNRAVFVRRTAPYDQPISADCVRKVIRQAYARAGLPYTRAHLLRHTMASRLLEGGGSLKEVADVLRHRSLNTTLIYAKLDSSNLATVALPWPGCTA